MNVEEFSAVVTELRRNRAMLSNCFMDRAALENALNLPKTQVLRDDGVIALLIDEPKLLRLYFYADGEDALHMLPRLLSAAGKTVVADVVGKDPRANEIADKLIGAGFAYNSTFVRLVCKTPIIAGAPDTSMVAPACEADVPYMLPLLQTEFSSFYSHFPEVEEFSRAAQKGEITVVRENGIPVAMAYFEDVSHRSKCLRYYIVDGACRGKGYGMALLKREFERNEAGQEYYLWIGTYNPTQKLYARIGFVHDGLMDYILTLDTNGEAVQEAKRYALKG